MLLKHSLGTQHNGVGLSASAASSRRRTPVKTVFHYPPVLLSRGARGGTTSPAEQPASMAVNPAISLAKPQRLQLPDLLLTSASVAHGSASRTHD